MLYTVFTAVQGLFNKAMWTTVIILLLLWFNTLMEYLVFQDFISKFISEFCCQATLLLLLYSLLNFDYAQWILLNMFYNFQVAP